MDTKTPIQNPLVTEEVNVNNLIKKLEKEGTSEDACKSAEEDVQKLTDAFIKKIDELLVAKEAEIMKV